MSVRDTGWEDYGFDFVYENRTIGEFHLSASTNGEWRLYQGATGTHDIARGTIDAGYSFERMTAAKRAAEDALRQLCRDTLKALGEP